MTSGDGPAKLIVTAEKVSARALSELLFERTASAADPSFIPCSGTVQVVNLIDEPFAVHRTVQDMPRGSLDVLYVRPRLFRYPEGLAALVYPGERCLDLFRVLDRLDSLLRDRDVVELEDLHFETETTLARVSRWLGRALPSVSPDAFGSASYGRAMAALAEHVQRPSIDLSPLLPIAQDQPVCEGHLASLLLRSGWYQPERDFIWSVASSSHIQLPLPAENRDLRCTIMGFKVRPDITISLVLNGAPVEALFFVQKNGVSLRAIFALHGARGEASVQLRYSHTVSPYSLDPASGDLRDLAFAISGIRLDEGARRELEGEWTVRDILEFDAGATALVTLPSSIDGSNVDELARAGARVIAQDIGEEGKGGGAADLRVGTGQGTLESFLKALVVRRRRVHVTIGLARIEEFLDAIVRLSDFANWISVTFLVDDLDSGSPILQWMALHDYALVMEPGRVLAFSQGQRDYG